MSAMTVIPVQLLSDFSFNDALIFRAGYLVEFIPYSPSLQAEWMPFN
jgi:hypothetical protein